MTIDISNIDKAELLAGLFNASKPQSLKASKPQSLKASKPQSLKDWDF